MTSVPPSFSPSPASTEDAAIAEGRMRRRVVLASVLGNGLEWFDFVSYGYFASIIAKVFFPADTSLSLVLTFAPLTVTWLIALTGSKLVPAYYIIVAGALSIVVVGSTVGAATRATMARR